MSDIWEQISQHIFFRFVHCELSLLYFGLDFFPNAALGPFKVLNSTWQGPNRLRGNSLLATAVSGGAGSLQLHLLVFGLKVQLHA